MNSNKSNNSGWSTIGAIIIVALIMCWSSCNDSRETAAFESQMSRHPSTWSKREQSRYNGFMDWIENQ